MMQMLSPPLAAQPPGCRDAVLQRQARAKEGLFRRRSEKLGSGLLPPCDTDTGLMCHEIADILLISSKLYTPFY